MYAGESLQTPPLPYKIVGVEQEQLYTIRQAARSLKVSPHTIRYWVRTKRLAPVARKGRGVRSAHLFRRTDVVSASTKGQLEDLKREEGVKNLITVTEMGTYLGISRTAAYAIVTRYKPTKYWIPSHSQYYIDGEEVYILLQDSPYYRAIIETRRL